MKAHMTVLLSLAVLCALACIGSLSVQAQAPKALMLFGGDDHDVFLGCLNCVDTSSDSICNEFGRYGSQFASDSIWNEFGEFGSEFNSHSPWNQFTNDAPIIVDKDGNSYGYFSANEFHHDRTQVDWAVAILNYHNKIDDLDKTRNHFCGDDDDDD